MPDGNFLEKSNAIFKELFDLANQELGPGGPKVEPSLIVERVISPLRALYFKNVSELLEAFLVKHV